MIFVCVGLPGRFAEWCDAAIARLGERLGGAVGVVAYPTVHEMLGYGPIMPTSDAAALTMLKDEFTHLVVGARRPDALLRAALTQTNARFVMALEDPRIAVSNLLDGSAAELSAATRAVANCCPPIISYLSMEGALTLRADQEGADPCAAIAAIAKHFGIDAGATEIEQIAGDLANRGLDLQQVAHAAWADRIPEVGRKMVDGALGAYAECFGGRSMGQIVWTRDLFMLTGDAANRPIRAIDVSGGTRNLIFGPYIHLPAGSWNARTVLGFSKEAVGYTFLVDVAAGPQLGASRLQPASGGLVETNIAFSLELQMDAEVELRVIVAEDMAKGELTFGHVVLTPLSPRRPESLAGNADFMAALDL